MGNSEKDQSQPASDSVLSITGDVDAYELTKDGKRKLTSFVWNHFKRKIINGEEKAVCNYCNKASTDIRQPILVREQKKVDGSSSYLSNYHFYPEKSRKDLASMIIIHEYPLSIVDHLGFKAYSEGLQPLFKVPSRNTIKSDIIKIYEIEKFKTMGLLDKIESKIALTSDMWTASNQKKGYMTITAHYIDDDWVMQSRILRMSTYN
ncbi:zinc finger BED domain-containing protein DAYSLEEPER-like [Vicia villosa]|uniref:zinc finger BED domain-containing protein DAYSLEEPER-like n=1 Tax=Vicia villosa TaxID=3911 RepID=UPI00273C4AE9|nr:zinc finger BED domain-containing protein DAYSLEEPER-like [Vicia villosa]